MRTRYFLRLLVAVLGLGALTGCSALSSLDAAAVPRDSFELTPLTAGTVTGRNSGRTLEVALPTATGAYSDDRIVIKPTAFQVQALPGVRWVNETTDLVQLLLARSIAGTGRYSLVSIEGEGPVPDLVLLTDLQAFQAEVTDAGSRVVVRTAISLVRGNGNVVTARTFENIVPVAEVTTTQVVAGFDRAVTAQLGDVARWLVASGV